jgi:hypothetical protein
MFGAPTDHPPLEWSWVEDQLRTSGSYWVTPTSVAPPHPRPVWGIWADDQLWLSIGSPVIARALAADARCTVHLPSSSDVVVVEGRVAGPGDRAELVAAYDAKYDWQYSVDDYGPFTGILPDVVMAWRAVGRDGRDGFERSGRWRV